MATSDVQSAVRDYYGELEETDDLEYNACCTMDYDPELTANLADEVLEKRYGCGSPIPELLEGRTVLDLGCGAGADCFLASQLVGPEGRVIGVDMSDEQLEVARNHVDEHMERFGYDEPNVEFLEGHIEDLPLDDASVDVVISNCVINLSPDKQAVYDEIWRVLDEGGEFYISDVVADRRVPSHLKEDDQLWSECLAGALYEGDLRRVEEAAGFYNTRLVRSEPTGDVVEGVRFKSQVRRGFKLDLEDRCEDYGQVAIYNGTIDGEPTFALDVDHCFEAGEPVRVCRNTAKMLTETRFTDHVEVTEPLRHVGPFEACGAAERVVPGESERGGASADGGDATDDALEDIDVPEVDSSSGCCS